MRRVRSLLRNRGGSAASYEKDWDFYAELIDDRKESPEWEILRRVRQSHWSEFSEIRPGQRVLDAGCGHGDYTTRLLEAGARVWAFDSAKQMVRATEDRLARHGLAAEDVTVDDVRDIPYPDESFDVALCLAVVDHLTPADRRVAVAELARVLKPGGRLYVNTPNRHAYHWRAGHLLMRAIGRFPRGRIRWFSPRELHRLVADAGLVPARALGLEFMPPFSGIYTTDLQRFTVFPQWLIDHLDRAYLAVETRARRVRLLQPFCMHYFLDARKPVAGVAGA